MEQIRKQIATGQYRFTLHALERCIERNKNYPQDKYGPSCLVRGVSKTGKALHVQCSLNPVWIITAYDPSLSPEDWESDLKTRRKEP
jgi:hypothetical protein